MTKAKRFFAIACATLLTLSISVPAQAVSTKVIGTAKVKSIVTKNTKGLKGKKLTIKLKTDDGVRYYDVSGKTSSTKYEFEIDAYSGKILERDQETIKWKKGKKSISKATARKLVDKIVARKNQKNYRIEADKEKGVKVYEITFKTATRKYEMTVNRTNGTIVERDWELLNVKPNIPKTTSSSSTKIGEAKANSIAVSQVKSKLGLSDSEAKNIKVVKTELEKDDGRYEYQVELRYGKYECDIDVDAYSGKVLECDIEIDD